VQCCHDPRLARRPALLPTDLAKTCIALIDRETRHARRGRPARIIAKFNGLLDPPMIQSLYRASQAGVEIDLIVRGQCALVPGLRGISSRIRVRSIVGRFLEHSRIFYFENGGKPDIYLGSADWMPRNLYARVEVLFPVRDPQLRERICNEVLAAYLSDNRKARSLEPDGCYVRPRSVRNGHGFSAQEYLMNLAQSGDLPLSGTRKRSAHLTQIYTPNQAASSPEAAAPDPSPQESSNAPV
jgi:polyphosphate kinase